MGQIDPELPFEIGPMNGREAPESGLRPNSEVVPYPIVAALRRRSINEAPPCRVTNDQPGLEAIGGFLFALLAIPCIKSSKLSAASRGACILTHSVIVVSGNRRSASRPTDIPI
jgi:hypothetical protein